jgi:hypothetical protein
MRGVLADENIWGHLPYLCQRLEALDEWEVVAPLALAFKTFADVGLNPGLDDRFLWNYCQAEGWVLFTDNRNSDDADSLQMTIADTWGDRLPADRDARK